jgi:hypothetical protein
MEPIKINVEVEVGLKQTTIDTLRQIFGAQIVASPAAVGFDPLPSSPAPAAEPEPKTERKAKKPAEKPAPAPESAPAPVADDDDLPPDDAPAPTKKNTPTEDEARQAVKAARDRGVSAKTIRSYMKDTFDIASSVECPAERRQELIDGLAKLAA